MNELTKRVLVAIVGIPLAFLIIFLGGWYFAGLILIISVMSAREFAIMLKNKDIFINETAVYLTLSLLVIIFQYFADSNIFSLTIAVILIVCLMGVLLPGLELWRNNKNPVASIGGSLLSVFYIGFSFLSLLAIRNFDIISDKCLDPNLIENIGAWLVVSIFVSIWVCDSLAYFVGSAIGKHKLFPRHSPKKSWEGAVGGFIGSVATFYLINYFVGLGFSDLFAILSGVIIGIAGQIGDLTESQFKREMGVKDSSNLIPGHGGLLDRFDSIIFVSPLMLILLIISQTCR